MTTPPILGYAVRVPGRLNTALFIDHAQAVDYAARMHGTLHALADERADAELLRQALAYILSDGDFLDPDAVESTKQLIAAIRARLGESNE